MVIAEWRGSPNATKYWEAVSAFKLAKLTEKDSFYDLGCGEGRVCIWAAGRCKYSKGIEEIKFRAMKAKRKVEKRHLFNVDIIKCNFEKIGFPDANVVLFTVVDLPLSDFKIWNRRRWCNSRIVTFGPPPIPIKPVGISGAFYLTNFPYSVAKTGDEWCPTIIGRRNATLDDVITRLERYHRKKDLRRIKRDYRKFFG